MLFSAVPVSNRRNIRRPRVTHKSHVHSTLGFVTRAARLKSAKQEGAIGRRVADARATRQEVEMIAGSRRALCRLNLSTRSRYLTPRRPCGPTSHKPEQKRPPSCISVKPSRAFSRVCRRFPYLHRPGLPRRFDAGRGSWRTASGGKRKPPLTDGRSRGSPNLRESPFLLFPAKITSRKRRASLSPPFLALSLPFSCCRSSPGAHVICDFQSLPFALTPCASKRKRDREREKMCACTCMCEKCGRQMGEKRARSLLPSAALRARPAKYIGIP